MWTLLYFAQIGLLPHNENTALKDVRNMKTRGPRWAITLLLTAVVFSLLPFAGAEARGRKVAPSVQNEANQWTQRTSRALIRMPLTVHVATSAGDPVASQARVTQWVLRANRALSQAGIEVYVHSVRHLPRGWRAVTKSQQRRRLAGYAPNDGTIHVFVTEELDKPRRRRARRRVRGLHWRYRGLRRELRQREYVVVTDGAPNTTFAHELGHLFGLAHSKGGTNIMCSCRRGSVLGFTGNQSAQMRLGANSFLSRQPTRYGAFGRRFAGRQG